jgi:hypothetical protein
LRDWPTIISNANEIELKIGTDKNMDNTDIESLTEANVITSVHVDETARDDGPYITLISSDDKQYQISKAAAIYSVFIKDSLGLDDNDDDDDNDDRGQDIEENNINNCQGKHEQLTINVLRVKGKCLQQVIEFLSYYSIHPMDDIPRLLDGTTFDSVIKQEWYRSYIYNILEATDNDTDTDENDSNENNNKETKDKDDDVSTKTAVTYTSSIGCSSTTDATTTTSNSSSSSNTGSHQYNNVVDETTTTVTTINSSTLQGNNSVNNNTTNKDTNNNITTNEMYTFPMNRKRLLELLAAANYMTIKPLLELICLWVTFQLQGKNYEQIRQFLYFPQITPDQEALARKKLPWYVFFLIVFLLCCGR